jgi:O-antigen/teichoic acid export membrane protein
MTNSETTNLGAKAAPSPAPDTPAPRAHGFFDNVVLTTGASACSAVLGLFTGTLSARFLEATGRGELAAIQLLAAWISIVATLGMRETVVYFAAREPERSGRVLATATVITLVSAPFLIAAAYPFLPYLLAGQRPAVIHSARLYLIALVPLTALILMPQHILRARRDLLPWNILRLAPAVGWMAVLLVAWAASWRDARTLAFGYGLSMAVLIIPSWIVAARLVNKPIVPQRLLARPMLAYGLPSMAANIPQSLNGAMPQIFLAAMLPPRILGLYVVALSWSGACMPVLGSISALALARVASQASAEDRHTVLAQTIRMTVLLAAAVGVILLAMTPAAISILFGKEFVASIPAAMVLLVGSLTLGVVLVLEEALRGLGNTKAIAPCEIAGLLGTVLLLALLLRPFGLMGAATAAAVGVFVTGAMVLRTIQHTTGVRLRNMLLPKRADVHLLLLRIGELVHRVRLWRSTIPVGN